MAQKTLQYNNTAFSLSYEIQRAKSAESKYMLFLHGWGSNKEVMKSAFSKCFLNYTHIYVDMPGFGDSDNDEVLHTSDYANIIKIFLDSLDIAINECIFVGHSFGGKVALLCNPKELILLSSAGIKRQKTLKVKTKILLAKMLKNIGLGFVGAKFRSKDVYKMSEKMYQTFKNVVDEDFSPYFLRFSGRANIFWGKQDDATPLSSGEKIASLVKNNCFFVLEGGHYFFLNQGSEIEKLFTNSCIDSTK